MAAPRADPPATGLEVALDRLERFLESYAARLALSFLIILSVLPPEASRRLLPLDVARLDPLFLLVFGPELLLRVVLYARRWSQRRATGWEPLLLLLDLLAVLSFLPLGHVLEARYLRLFRLTRMLLLLGYWGGTVRDLWDILSSRERRYQVVLVLLLGLVLSFAGAVLLVSLAPAYDFDDDGALGSGDRDFFHVLWWSFRQVQDPGNLVARPSGFWVVAVSLVLTFAGLVLFSFLIGIGTNAVGELMDRARERPVGLYGHTVILGLTAYGHFLLEELAEIYRKNLRPFRAVVLGEAPQAPDFLHQPRLRSFRYRAGSPADGAALDRLDLHRARRVLILGTHPRHPDAEVLATILAARDRNPTVDLYPDLEHEKNFRAARAAGGARTHIVGSGSFLGQYIAQNVIYPGVYRLYRQLLTSAGCEIYTYVFPEEERRRLVASGAAVDPEALHRRAYLEHGITLLGLFTAAEQERPLEVEDCDVLLNPAGTRAAGRLGYAFDGAGRLRLAAARGLIAVALRWEDVRRLAGALLADPDAGPPPGVGPASFPDLELRLPQRPLERVLVCGESLRVPRVLAELIGFYGALEITVLARETGRLGTLRQDVEAALATHELLDAPPATDAAGAASFTAAGGAARVRLLPFDWTDTGRLLRHGAVDLAAVDAILFLPGGARSEERDGTVALDCLRMVDLEARGIVRFRSDLRVLGIVQDPTKGDLLERRLEAMAGADRQGRYIIISGERARHHYIMQNVFVRGLNAVYLDLLGARGQHLGRLRPTAGGGVPAGDFSPWDLARHLLLERGMLFVGLELELDGETPEVILDPRLLSPGRRLPWSAVRAVYALGEGPRLLDGCPRGAGGAVNPAAATSR